MSPLTRRSHPSPSSGHHYPSPGAGAGEAGGGRRARGLSVPRALPPRSQPGLQCCPRCRGSGAAHRTGWGEVRGEEPQGRVSTNKKPPYPRTQEMPPPCPSHLPYCPQVSQPCSLRPPMSHGAVWVGLKALSSSLPLDPWTVKNVPSEIPSVWAGGSRGERLTQVLDLRVRVAGGQGLAGWQLLASHRELGGERCERRERLGGRCKRKTEGRRD